MSNVFAQPGDAMKTKSGGLSGEATSPARQARSENILRFRCPPVLPAVVRRAADQQMLSVSSYLRRATAEQLKRDGFSLDYRSGAA
jgi:hypothetical protein